MKTIILSLGLLTGFANAEMRPIPKDEMITPLLKGASEITSLQEIERLGLRSGSTGINLWSGHYWPNFQGGLAARYRDPGFIKLMESKAQYDKFKDFFVKMPSYAYTGKENFLSPAEKYDLIAGDSSFGLTKWSIDESDKMQKTMSGGIPIWRGICDGWSAATQMMPRPVKSVTLNASNGTPVTFYPEDIKALGSMLYANAQDPVIFLGKRCRSQVVGLFTGSCNGTNSAAFHRALVNRVGKLKQTFIADVSPSKEVWNYPVHSYDFTYYNVFTEEESPSYTKVLELFNKKNKFAHSGKRHPNTYAIVGVKAVVKYTDMREPHLLETDGVAQDKLLEKEYYYDLELDRNYNIVGGEWISQNYPDFIWAPNDRTYPLSEVEVNGLPKTSAEITAAAKLASKKGQPLSVIVERLFELSK